METTMSQNQITDYGHCKGKTTIAPEVLLTITRLTTLEVPGVSRMSNQVGGVNRILKRGVGEGVFIDVRNDVVYADLYIVLHNGVNIREVSRQVQRNVARAITEMVGMQIGRINVHVEDIDYPEPKEPSIPGLTER